MAALDPETIRQLLCRLGEHIRDRVLEARNDPTRQGELSTIVGSSSADTLYEIDRISDDALLQWFAANWPSDEPVELITEALDAPVVLPADTPADELRWTCIVDPIDGTRGLMYDKRSAWVLAAAAPRRNGRRPSLQDVTVAAMTEIPVVKQWGSDQISGVRGCGAEGLVVERHDVRTGARAPLEVRPSSATGLEHGWASFARFFPLGKARLAAFEERLWDELHGGTGRPDLAIFDDQYLATGGQFHELMVGHDRLLGDLRPLVFTAMAGNGGAGFTCHPYDCCTAILVEEAGCVVRTPWGEPLDPPLDTTTAVAWVGYANPALAAWIEPVLLPLLAEFFGPPV